MIRSKIYFIANKISPSLALKSHVTLKVKLKHNFFLKPENNPELKILIKSITPDLTIRYGGEFLTLKCKSAYTSLDLHSEQI